MKLGCVVMQKCPRISLLQCAGIATSRKLWIQTFQEFSKLLNPGRRILCSWKWRGAQSSFLSPEGLRIDFVVCVLIAGFFLLAVVGPEEATSALTGPFPVHSP